MENRICSYCGKAYIYRGHMSGDHTKFCSDECAKASVRDKNRGYYRSNELVAERQRERVLKRSDARRQLWLETAVPEGFEYIGGWQGGNTSATFRCLKHNAVFDRKVDAARCNATMRCPECAREYARAIRGTKETRAERSIRIHIEALQRKDEEHQRKLDNRISKRCAICGKSFLDWYGGNRKTCSPECSKEYSREYRRLHDKRLNKDNTIDKNITLRRLYKRDGGICYICGCKCDWNDKTARESGTVIYGQSYPTIEHILPISRGGVHSWANVKLACWGCNLRKSDRITNAAQNGEMVIPSRKSQPKRTEQLDKSGTLIKTYQSTAQAARETGLKAKQIQNCARGETKQYKGFIWRYA